MSIFHIHDNMRLEPKRTHMFTFVFAAVPGNESSVLNNLQIELISFGPRPTISYSVKSANRFNMKYNVAEKPSWGEGGAGGGGLGSFTLSFRDNIQTNLARVFWNWNKNIFNFKTGLMGYAASYKTDGYLYIFDPRGSVIEKWNYYGIFPSSIEFGGDFSYGEGGAGGGGETTIKATFQYDWVEMDESVTTPTSPEDYKNETSFKAPDGTYDSFKLPTS